MPLFGKSKPLMLDTRSPHHRHHFEVGLSRITHPVNPHLPLRPYSLAPLLVCKHKDHETGIHFHRPLHIVIEDVDEG